MGALSAFGLFAVTAMLVAYALEQRHPGFILAFAAACAMGSAYAFLQGAWPFGLVEAVWVLVALRRWSIRSQNIAAAPDRSRDKTGQQSLVKHGWQDRC
jgi:hypothetical protein